MEDREFFNCACHSEGIILENLDFDDDSPDLSQRQISFAIWTYGHTQGKMSLKERVRWCWNILVKGVPWCDQTMMLPEEAKRFAHSILKRLGEE